MHKLKYILIFIFFLVGCVAPSYIVTFDLDGGVLHEGELTQEVIEGENAIEPIVSKEGFVFDGWSNSINGIVQNNNIMARWRNYNQDEIYEMSVNAVVEIISYENNESLALGSGFFYNNMGEIITNYHVIKGATSLKVILNDESEFQVTSVLGYDEILDLAILKINHNNTHYLEISDRELKTGENIYALGSSKGFTNTFSTGNISQLNREIDGVNLIQMTAPISSGNSGGPLIDIYGKVIGINAMKYTDGDNIYFSINVSELENIDKSTPLTVEEFVLATDPELKFKQYFINNSSSSTTNNNVLFYTMTHVRGDNLYTFYYIPTEDRFYINYNSESYGYWVLIDLDEFPFFRAELLDDSGDLIGYDDNALFLSSSLKVIIVFDAFYGLSSLKTSYVMLLELYSALMLLVFDQFIESKIGEYLLL